MVFRFDGYELDTKQYELRHSDEIVALEPQVFDVLAYLVEHHGEIVTRDELLEKVWGDKYISEAALNSRLMAARRAIGDNGNDQRLIKTIRGRGFRFTGRLNEEAGTVSAAAESNRPVSPRSTLEQEIRFCRAPDGVRIAYATVGDGPVLVKAPNWLSHLEFELESPVWRHWWETLAQDFKLVRFDQRGSGLSDRDVADISLEAWISDLEAVVDATGEGRFDLLGISQGGAVAVEYAIRHPEKVRKLVLYGAYTRGRIARGESRSLLEATMTIMREGWAQDSPAYRQLFTSQFMPGATVEQMNWFNELQRISTSGENAARIQFAGSHIDVLDRLPLVTAPTLVLHAIADVRVPFDEGRLIASSIPNARLVTLASKNHLTVEDEPAWERLVTEVKAFLLDGA
jgi:pimeloyl-ACP methyl ester carboxylesterase/DNA-binding winged helix-turn-helix (wHTH) protein